MSLASAATLEPVEFRVIPGWTEDDFDAALEAFRRSCTEILNAGAAFQRPVTYGGERRHWTDVCSAAETASDARNYFESNFVPLKVRDGQRPQGLFTGYYEPEVEGRLSPDAVFHVPIYRKPADLVSFGRQGQDQTGMAHGRMIEGRPAPYATRQDIEAGALAGKGLELLWLKDWADAFFIHVQGSGRVRLEDGTIVRLAYAAKSGHPYTGIGGILAARGAFSRDEMSMQAIRSWMGINPQAARELMWQNESFIFFRTQTMPNPALGPIGAQHVQLSSGRSLAIDRNAWMFGTPVWLDTTAPTGPGGGLEPFRRLLIAQDTGSAIKGLARGDVFWGSGENAETAAGHMKSAGRMIVLLPVGLVRDMGLAP